ncbi:response regulator [Flavimaricola marinus]|uniref:histidine kinase n=1 Tax=Flavimaricola marinus TaxID=1819565 RepID=A0A238LD98_9RHOB|nr:response regulator [Flavimaricola marinus]SMY07659.1 Aerobic respiration control sensor protein ArcB [Flavimaricola marinus]
MGEGQKRSKRRRPWFYSAILAVTICFFAIGILAREVSRDILLLDTATSDNVQWTLSQVEVEFLEFETDLTRAAMQDGVGLAQLRREFDVFYSRVKILREGDLYEPLRSFERFGVPLQQVQVFLDDTAVLIDADDATLTASLARIAAETSEMRPIVRQLSNAGLSYFAESADQRRSEISTTMFRLAVLVVLLIITLAGLALYLNSVTARIARRERENRETNARINTIVSTSLDAVISTDGDGAILDFNAAAEAIFGYDAQDVRGKNIKDVIIPDHLMDAHVAGMDRMHRTGEKRVVGHGRVQLEAKRSTGEIFPVEFAIQTAQIRGKEIFIAFLRDISAREKAQADLIDARDAALAGEKAKSEFLAVMSHEIRTPLNGLLGNLSLLQETEVSPKQRAYIANMDASGRLLMSHVTDVLDITRYDAGKLQPDIRIMDLNAFLQELIDNQSGPAQEQNTELSWRWVGEPIAMIMSDRDLLQPILLNLIGNAVKFTKDGTIELIVEAKNRSDQKADIEFRIVDTGIGIEESAQPLIFDDFQTGNASYSRLAGGTGLGLGIAKRFATALGGEVGAKSVYGEGSTFWVRLSFDLPGPNAVESAENAQSNYENKSILVVEDNQINRQVVREMLSAMGHHVTEAHDGKQGVDAAQSTAFDVILMDINMPNMDGREATRAIRAGDGPNAQVPIFALTANAIAEDRANFLADGMTDVLTKPLRKAALDAMLRRSETSRSAVRDEEPTVAIDATQTAEIKEALGEEPYAKMRTRFFAEGDDLIAWLAEPPNFDSAEYATKAHRFAGSAAIFGATELHDLLKALEEAATGADRQMQREVSEALESLWPSTKAALTVA